MRRKSVLGRRWKCITQSSHAHCGAGQLTSRWWSCELGQARNRKHVQGIVGANQFGRWRFLVDGYEYAKEHEWANSPTLLPSLGGFPLPTSTLHEKDGPPDRCDVERSGIPWKHQSIFQVQSINSINSIFFANLPTSPANSSSLLCLPVGQYHRRTPLTVVRQSTTSLRLGIEKQARLSPLNNTDHLVSRWAGTCAKA